jgi:hypothetical protein
LLAVSREQGFRFFTAMGLYFAGWVACGSGDRARGVVLMREAADLYTAVGHRVGLRMRSELAERLIDIGLPGEAIEVVDQCLRQAGDTGEGDAVPELYRMRARAVERQAPGDPAVEADLQRALALASRQGAWLHALRAAADLVRVQRRRGGAAASERSLREIHGRFTDGLDLPDLEAARALLESGGASAAGA